MKKILFWALIIICLSTSFVLGINEKELKKNIKDTAIQEGLKATGVDKAIEDKIPPELKKDLKKTCELTSGMRTFLWILSLLAIAGIFTFPQAGVILLILDIFLILNYACIFT